MAKLQLDIEMIVLKHALGWSYGRIARDYYVSTGTIYNRLREVGAVTISTRRVAACETVQKR